MRSLFLFYILTLSTQTIEAQKLKPPIRPEAAWFDSARFGIFMHWMLDGIPEAKADKRQETFRRFQEVSRREALKFTADQYNPEAWAALIKNWGAKYTVLTTKHHLGFALYGAPGQQFNAKEHSGARKDLLKPWVEAIRKEGLKVGLYFSLPDRMHPDYETLEKDSAGKWISKAKDQESWNKFSRQMLSEIAFLCKNYGQIDLFWFDGDWERSAKEWCSFQIMDTIRKYQPKAVVNNRLRHIDLGDYATPEMILPLQAPGHYPMWELCTTLGYNWNGKDAERDIKSPEELIRILAHTCRLGGNLLLNVSPDYKGVISTRQIEPMNELGNFIRQNQEAIYGSKAGLPLTHFEGASTQKNGILYLWVLDYPENEIVLKGIEGRIVKASILHNGQNITWREMADYHNQNGRRGWRFFKLPPKSERPALGLIVKIEFENNTFTIAEK